MNLFNILLAALGLSFLIFIHELGHFIMARRVKIRVEVFSIGFGKPIYSWMHRGVKWQVCYFLFGGYVKMAGMEKENGKEVHDIQDGFFGKKPLDRILVAVMGPLVNSVFALLVFAGIWASGGRVKPFAANTKIIGWVDSQSELAKKGVKPGDTIVSYNGKPFTGFKDLAYNSVLKDTLIEVSGEKVDYLTGRHEPYRYQLEPYEIEGTKGKFRTTGVMAPASFLNFHGFDAKLKESSPARESGIEKGDRILWVNGELVFSLQQLQRIVNSDSVLMTVERGNKKEQLRVARVPIDELQLTSEQRDEFNDWKRSLSLKESINELYFIPYEVDELGVVKGRYSFIDSDLISEFENGLTLGDRIVSVQGEPVNSGLKLFEKLKDKKVVLIVQKANSRTPISWKNEDRAFVDSVNWASLGKMIQAIGTPGAVGENEEFKILRPIEPMMQDGQERLGLPLSDQMVVYNPSPFVLFNDALKDMWTTISSLVRGSLSPKWLSGPVGIVQVMHDSWSIGIKEALYWMGLISLNLGIMNLLPLPVLDGGHICFSLWEMITRRRIASKTMERLVLPFVVLIIAFFVYVTYQDVSRLFLK